MRFILAVLVVLSLVGKADAQLPVIVAVWPASWGALEVETTIETDGNPATLEFLLWRYSDYQWRVVAIKADGTGMCAGPWFSFLSDTGLWPRIRRVGAVDHVFVSQRVQSTTRYVEFVIDHPTVCYP